MLLISLDERNKYYAILIDENKGAGVNIGILKIDACLSKFI